MKLYILLLLLQPSHAPRPPLNIVLIQADDLATDALSPYRQPALASSAVSTLGLHKLFKHLKTPHLQALADEGVTFARAYTASSICSPSRYSTMTGKYPSRSRGAVANSKLHPNAWKVTIPSARCGST